MGGALYYEIVQGAPHGEAVAKSSEALRLRVKGVYSCK